MVHLVEYLISPLQCLRFPEKEYEVSKMCFLTHTMGGGGGGGVIYYHHVSINSQCECTRVTVFRFRL